MRVAGCVPVEDLVPWNDYVIAENPQMHGSGTIGLYGVQVQGVEPWSGGLVRVTTSWGQFCVVPPGTPIPVLRLPT